MTKGLEGCSLECGKELVEWALAAGRAFQSAQTGYIHYHHPSPHSHVHDTIPLYENCLFALALLRSRLVENIQEAKAMLQKILVFQRQERDSSHGNFPFYLHDYPNCYDAQLGVQLLAPLYWILKQFGHVLGQELREKLEKSLGQLVDYGIRVHQAKPLPYSQTARLASGLMACGALLQQNSWHEFGKKIWDQLDHHPNDSWYSTAYLADLLISLQMVEEKVTEGPWVALWQFIAQTWHRQAGCYMGPCIREWQEQEEPQPTLYDLFLGCLYGQFSPRAHRVGIYHLQGALIQSVSLSPQLLPVPYLVSGRYKEQSWMLFCDGARAYTILEKNEAVGASLEKTYTPFRLVWTDGQRAHTFVCQGGKFGQMHYRRGSESIELFFDLDQVFLEEAREKQREICFYFDFHPHVQVHIEDRASTTFELGQPVTIKMGEECRLSLVFELVQGDGEFLGHLARGNRPSQVKQKEEKMVQAYDWTLFLRTVRRHSACRIKAALQFI